MMTMPSSNMTSEFCSGPGRVMLMGYSVAFSFVLVNKKSNFGLQGLSC